MIINYKYSGLNEDDILRYKDEVKKLNQVIDNKSGAGSDYLGWTDYVSRMSDSLIKEINEVALEIRDKADVLVVLGIGGSYLGARAVIESLRNSYDKKPEILFCGNSISSEEIHDLLEYIKDKSVYVNVISKSGRTLETALSFRIFRKFIEDKYEDESSKRIIATTDEKRGALIEISKIKGYRTFIIPDDVGGRYSVFTPVGLIPIAAAGININEMLEGVIEGEKEYSVGDLSVNEAYKYAVIRNELYKSGKKIEILVNYDPKLQYIGEWYKQLYGESEGKDNLGIFPSSSVNSTDLHSLGQYIQEGERTLFETIIDFKEPVVDIVVEEDESNLDGLNYLVGKRIGNVNRTAMIATILAHKEGGVPNNIVELDKKTPKSIGKLLYFFMKACAMSGYLLGVNPFNQPGVESYKNNMFALLGKPGTEELAKELNGKLSE